MAVEIAGSASQQAFVQTLDRKADIKSAAVFAERKSETARASEDNQDRERRNQKAAERGGIDIDV